ncbi:MAG: primosomal protein N' [Lentisphaerae bacterium]|nr:primosomal protein N' [Lentisphaerota bacterium]
MQQRADNIGSEGDDEASARVAQVVFNLSLDKGFDYAIPPALRGQLRAGSRVRVSFGHSERSGFVVSVSAKSRHPGRLKPILALEKQNEQIPSQLLGLAEWLARYYCCPKEHAVRALMPAVVRSGAMKHKQLFFVSLTLRAANFGEDFAALTEKQQQVIQHLHRQGAQPLQELQSEVGVSATVINTLCKHGWLHKEKRVVSRDPFHDDLIQPDSPRELTTDQEAALERINASQDAKDAQVFLLHGVTASGKTEVYLQAIHHCLEHGRDAIVLVPEISLTPQTCDRFRRRFGNLVSVLHSGLSDGERFDEWTRINEGRSRIAVGARSALFAPFRKLGLIVVDEEHENSYKQEDSPRYNARDVAVLRGKLEQACVVLGSATPSLESYYNCEIGRYALVELPERVDASAMPAVELIDMAEEAALAGQAQLFSKRLKELILDRLHKAEQIMLLLNRRGYATQLLCPQCGYVATCDNCSCAYTYHRKAAQLICHLCGVQLAAPEKCPQCASKEIRYTGVGTEKIEGILRALYPQATIARMDSDTMTSKDSYKTVLDAFRAGRIHILVGTQMIAKGLDFPNVTLVGVIQADSQLHLPDFRSGERTFQLITQVAGRAGRGDCAGHVVVQTYTPYHFALQAAIKHDFKAFYAEEMPGRRMLDFPPCSRMVIVHFRSQEEALAAATAEKFHQDVLPLLEPAVQIIGPMPAPLSKVKTYYRFQLQLRGGSILKLVALLRPLVVGRSFPKGVDVYLDVDPRNLM